MSGGWPTWARKFIEEVSVWFVPVFFFFLYVLTAVFAMTRIISALLFTVILDGV
eukprot:CAMPEP_0177195088 /NCGR_PEP_ID=MMETSP0367-20130122/23324_1 /TAXON_ID=447022 ORGANISM="Scrippsiella hangoei-like, Strain SHHI-4" /NCGR_SAMPLE_ID=MMETSP0367 /ASSEMBLY_ACC=CAM_ASM_000362 /LENGTH=53 /DNA_ID=CAMNT_0018643087 /DNA_START=30 /DNA_END=191 /DNA_ORIENTATION=+